MTDVVSPTCGRMTPPRLSTLVLLTGLSALSISIFLPSLPSMATYFGVDYAVVQLAVGLYLVLNAPVQLIAGPLSDVYGRRPVLLISCLLFLIATLGCMLATDVYVFLFFRASQAVIVSAAVVTRAIVRDTTAPEKSASQIGYIMMGMAMVPMIGPTLGGFLDEWFGWQASFALLLGVGILIVTLLWIDLGETALQRSGTVWAQFKDMPELLKSRRFWGYAIASACANGAFFLFLSGGPLLGDLVFGLTPAEFGLYFAATPLGYIIGNFLSTQFADRIGTRRMIWLGLLVCVFGPALALCLSRAGQMDPVILFGLIGLVGVGNGMLMPSATVGMLSVRGHLVGSASGLGAALMTAGGAVLSAMAGFLVFPGSGLAPLIFGMIATFAAAASTFAWVFHLEK